MKKICSLTLLLALTLSLWGCARPIIYEEEKTIHTWLNERTEGYDRVPASSRMILYQDEKGFTVKIDTGTNALPRISIEDDKTNVIATENSLLTVTNENSIFAQATHENSVFDPYRNSYTRSMKVYQKDESSFRVFLWLYGSPTDFYPIPQLLTQSQYTQMLEIVKEYTEKKAVESEAADEDPFNYTADFMSLYEGRYFSDKATNQQGAIFYQYNDTPSKHFSAYRTLFSQLNLTEQDWRASFESLGYTGQKLNLHIVYFDIYIGRETVDITLMTSDTYTSHLLASQDQNFTYAFCPSLASQDFIHVKQK